MSKKKIDHGYNLQRFLKYLVLAIFFVLMAYPLIWLFYSSVKSVQEIYDSVFALPKKIDLSNFRHIWGSSHFPRYYLNSLIVSISSVFGIVLFSSLTGFIFGGGCQNLILDQWSADETGLTVYAGPVEATALGNMLVQGVATGHIASLQEGRAQIIISQKVKQFDPQ